MPVGRGKLGPQFVEKMYTDHPDCDCKCRATKFWRLLSPRRQPPGVSDGALENSAVRRSPNLNDRRLLSFLDHAELFGKQFAKWLIENSDRLQGLLFCGGRVL